MNKHQTKGVPAPPAGAAGRASSCLPNTWSETRAEYPVERGIHHFFEDQAARSPEAVALQYGAEHLSYGSLNGQANQLAGYLRTLGAGHETLVAVAITDSPLLGVALLGILKAGGAYLPLDLSYPADRLELMLAECQVSHLLTLTGLKGALPAFAGNVLCLDAPSPPWSIQPVENLDLAHDSDQLAYLVYTSGSTGRPKGTAITHRGVTRLVIATNYIQIQADDRVGQMANIAFDALTFEIWGALLNGAATVGIDRETALSPKSLAAFLRESRISCLFLTTALFNRVAQEAPRAFTCLRALLFGGEAVDPRTVRQVLKEGPPENLLHVYGPTENTTFSTSYLVGEVGPEARTIAIGPPIANTTARALTSDGHALPAGEPGELLLGGDGLARCYWRRPELTADRFRPDPFADAPGLRVYHTGDVVTYSRDGAIFFQGRADHQIKLRGFRIELGEIEAALLQHPQIEDAVVVLGRDASDLDGGARDGALEKYLIAYVQPTAAADSATSHTRVLRQFLAARLPEYMIPAAFVILAKFPLNPNGKIDRKALPQPERTRPLLAEPYRAPSGLVEEKLVDIWEKVLNLEGIGTEDDFFELGGHSIAATAIIARVERDLHFHIPPRTFFQNATIHELGRILSEQGTSPGRDSAPALIAIQDRRCLPLSPAQQRLWLLDRLNPESRAYHLAYAFRLEGALDPEVLRASLGDLVRRHESLRTIFPERDGVPVQVLVDAPGDCLRFCDLRSDSGDESAALDRIRLTAREPFDLASGPLVRFELLQTGDREFLFLLALHHLIADGWSMGVLFRELGLVYDNLSGGKPAPAFQNAFQYGDWSEWQRRWLEDDGVHGVSAILASQSDFWRETLAGARDLLELPIAAPRPARQSFRGTRLAFSLPAESSAALRALSRSEGVTPFMVLLAAYAALLFRYSNQTDILIGAPVAGRSRVELEPLIGFFVQTLVLRTRPSANLPFRAFLAQVRQTTLDGLAHADLPFERVVELVKPERHLGANPLFQVAFALHNVSIAPPQLGDVKATPAPVRLDTALFDLSLEFEERDSGYVGELEFASALFDAETAQGLIDHYLILLDEALKHPDRALADLTWLTAEERTRVLGRWNQPARPAAQDLDLLTWFERTAIDEPDAPAIRSEDGVLSYGELDLRANSLASLLGESGVGPDIGVGIALRRGSTLVTALLAVMKAGGYYLPLEPGHPAERLAFILAEQEPAVVLTRLSDCLNLPSGDFRVIHLDSTEVWLSQRRQVRRPSPAAPENLAYVIYTSGSTGRPKGVAVSRRAILNRLLWARDIFPMSRQDRFLQIAGFGFDIAFWEILAPLTAGAELVAAPSQWSGDTDLLLDFIAKNAITVAHFVPSLLRALLAESQVSRAHSLRMVFCGGEAVPRELQKRFFEHFPHDRASLFQFYGPTEAAINVTSVDCGQDGAGSLGRPIANTQIYIMDDRMRLQAVGVPGELCIGGVALARGYTGQAGQTAERFVPNPCALDLNHSRLYRTGDKARFLADGRIQYLGRLDQQVKLRGFRIEPGEIEAVLETLESIGQAVVMVQDGGNGDQYLVACVTLNSIANEASADSPDSLQAGWRKALSLKLPAYMTPSLFVICEAFPLTANGKIDRKALAANLTESRERALGEAYRPPQTRIETELAQVWEELLGRARIGTGDHFFECGGHSLLATRLASRIRDRLEVDLPLTSIFEFPRLEDLALEIARLQMQGQAVRRLPIPPRAAVKRADEGELPDFPLSFAQSRLWFLDRLEPGGAVYNLPIAVTIGGDLDVPMLRRCFTEIVARHEALRTRFREVSGIPRQIISPAEAIELTVIDLSGAVGDGAFQSNQDFAQRLTDEAHRPFDLTGEMLIRFTLYRLNAAHVLLINMHHIVSDAWSTQVLFRELAVLYRAFLEGRPSPLAPLPVQYADFSLQQRADQDLFQGQEAYWQAQLAGLPPHLDLPVDLPRPAVFTSRGAVQDFWIGEETVAAIDSLCRTRNVTPFMVLLTGFAVMLGRHCGQSDFAIGSPIANRNRAETEELIGFFVNTLALRMNLGPNRAGHLASFDELIERTRKVAIEGYAHQDLPFERVVELVKPERDLSRAPLFQAMFALENVGSGKGSLILELPGLEVAPYEFEYRISKFDISLYVSKRGSRFFGRLEYCADLFRAETIARMAARYCRLMASLTRHPERPAARALLLDEEELDCLRDWNDDRLAFAEDACMHRLFEDQVARTPNDQALICGAEALNYAELNARANRLAHLLIGAGIGLETPVALLLERSVEMLVAILAVLKSGGCYVPLDPAYPAERIGFTLEDTSAPLILTRRRFSSAIPAHITTKPIFLEEEAAGLASFSATNPGRYWDSHAVAYILFTSGSTGRPKGVAIAHQNVAAMLAWATREYDAAQRRRVLAATSICFDLSIFEMFLPLTSGGTLVLVDNALGLLDLRQPVGLINTVPSAITELNHVGGIPESVATINLAGEPLRLDLVQALYSNPWVEKVYNLYGPSEDTTYSTYALIPRDTDQKPAIGRPLPNSRVFLVDRNLELVPIGCPGELCLAGSGLARGYHRRPGLTAEKFIPDPFSNPPGTTSRLYRTGDLARYRPNGELEYLGRIDHQVKVRGFRIELGEIETALRAHGEVTEAVVLARDLGRAGSELVAFVTPAQADGEGAETVAFLPSPGSPDLPSAHPDRLRQALKVHLGQRLPAFMTPSLFVFVDPMPLTPNGKIDRKALTQMALPELRGGPAASRPIPPQNQAETIMAGIWAQVLGIAAPSRDGQFFELGGHSLLAIQMLARIRDLFKVDLPVKSIFQFPRIGDLTTHVLALKGAGEGEGDQAGPIQAAPRDGDLPLSFSQERAWFLDQLEPFNATYNVPLLLRIEGNLNAPALHAALTAITARHESLRTHFVSRDGHPLQAIAPPGPVTLAFTDLTAEPSDQRETLANQIIHREVRHAFSLETGPLASFTLVRVDARRHLFLANFHHIIFDLWSAEVFLRELTALYPSFAAGEVPQPDPLPLQYADFSVWQRQRLSGEVLAAQLAFWKRHLGSELTSLRLPLDFARPLRQTFSGAMLPIHIEGDTTAAIEALSRTHQATMFMILLAAFKTLLYRYSGQPDIVVGAPIANRNRSEFESVIGFFINTLPLRTNLADDPEFLTLVDRVRESSLNAFAHGEIPFEKLVDEIETNRDLSRTPIFQVMFVMQQLPRAPVLGEDLSLSLVDVENGTSKFDLTLYQWEADGELRGFLEYNTNLFRPETAARMISHWNTLLCEIAARPRQRISAFNILGKDEIRQLKHWNQTRREFPPIEQVQAMFEARAAQQPEAAAVRTAEIALSYGDLEGKANQLAHHLIGLGVGPETVVAISLQRSPQVPVAVLAVLKAGGAYMPLDPSYPLERLAFMLADTNARVVISEQELSDRFVGFSGKLVSLDRDAAFIAAQSDKRPRVRANRDNLAYLLFTSGSTGQPKAVAMSHRPLINLIQWQEEATLYKGPVVNLQFASLSFDVSFQEMFHTWNTGGTLALIGDQVRRDPEAMLRYQEALGVTSLYLPFVALQQLAQMEDSITATPALQEIVTAGEPLRVTPQLRRFMRNLDGCRLHNQYGPTETHVCTAFTLSEIIDQWEDSPSIGRPIANAQIHLLDRDGHRVPIGVPGQIHIGGILPARGYFNRPDLTADRFRPDPFEGEPGARMYMTGDLARYSTDGDLAFLGRIDHQVKVRGFRIEPGEVEAALSSHDEVEDIAVLTRAVGAGDHTLVAYILLNGLGGLSQVQREAKEKDLYRFAVEKLPEYMVPSTFVLMDSFPLTPSGKLDRSALPAPERRRSAAATFIAPASSTEQRLTEIWQEILGIEQVGVNDSFFDLGGHSLLIPRLHVRIKNAFSSEHAMVKLFEYPTIASFAKYLEEMRQQVGAVAASPSAEKSNQRASSRREALLRKQRQKGR